MPPSWFGMIVSVGTRPRSSILGRLLTIAGVVLLLLAGLAWMGAGLNKTGTGLVEPLIAVIGFALVAAGVSQRRRSSGNA